MELFVVRHGESVANAESKYPTDDVELTPKGRQQAAAHAEWLSKTGVDVIFASPILRAAATARIIAARAGCPVFHTNELRDTGFGVLAGRMMDGSDSSGEEKLLFEQRRRDRINFSPPGGDSFADTWRRTMPMVERILRTGSRRVCVVSHLYVNRAVVGRLAGLSMEESYQIRQENDVLYHISGKNIGHVINGARNDGLLFKEI